MRPAFARSAVAYGRKSRKLVGEDSGQAFAGWGSP